MRKQESPGVGPSDLSRAGRALTVIVIIVMIVIIVIIVITIIVCFHSRARVTGSKANQVAIAHVAT